jgi:hypothetical protein
VIYGAIVRELLEQDVNGQLFTNSNIADLPMENQLATSKLSYLQCLKRL